MKMQDSILMNRIDHVLELMRMFSAYTGPGECTSPSWYSPSINRGATILPTSPKTSQNRMNPSFPNYNFLFFS